VNHWSAEPVLVFVATVVGVVAATVAGAAVAVVVVEVAVSLIPFVSVVVLESAVDLEDVVALEDVVVPEGAAGHPTFSVSFVPLLGLATNFVAERWVL